MIHTHPHRRAGLAVLPALALAAAACAEAELAGTEVERADSAGIEIVTNRGGDVPLDWRFEAVVRLGGTDDGPEAFGSVQVATDAAGNLYVLDTSRHQVISFDPEGRHRWSAGQPGGGPGEIQFPIAFTVTDDGVTHVFDPSKTGFVRWDAEGELLGDFRLEIPFFGGRLAVLDGAVAFDGQGRTDDASTLRTELRLHPLASGEPESLASVENRMRGPIAYPGCGITLSGQPAVLAPGIVWDAYGARLVHNRQPAYELVVVEGLEATRVVRRDVAPRRATVEDATLEVADPTVMVGGNVECRIPASQVVETRGIAEHVPTVFQVRVAPDGTLWVNRLPRRAGGTRIDVFDPTGEYLGTLPDGAPFPSAFTPEGHPVTVERDEMDLPYVVVYRAHGSDAARTTLTYAQR